MWLPNALFLPLSPNSPLLARLRARAALSTIVLPGLLVGSHAVLYLKVNLGSFCLLQFLAGMPCPGCGISRGLAFTRHQ